MNTCTHAWHDPSQCPFCREEELQSLRGEIERLRADLTATNESLTTAAKALNEEERENEHLQELVNGTIDRNSNLASENARLRELLREDLREWQQIADATKGAADMTVRATAVDRLCAIDEALGE